MINTDLANEMIRFEALLLFSCLTQVQIRRLPKPVIAMVSSIHHPSSTSYESFILIVFASLRLLRLQVMQ